MVGVILTAVHIVVNLVAVTITETIDRKVQIRIAVHHAVKMNHVVVIGHMETIENMIDPIVAVIMIEMNQIVVHIVVQTNHVVVMAIKVG